MAAKQKIKHNHEPFLEVVNFIEDQTIRGADIVLNVSNIRIIINEAKWLRQWLNSKKKAGQTTSENKGRPVSSDNPESVLRRKFRQAKKLEPNLTMTEFKQREGIEIKSGGRPFGTTKT